MTSGGRARVPSVIIAVGDELLLGRTVDTNGAWMAGRLAELGAPAVRRYVVADNADEIAAALRGGLAAARVVVLCGGLGPTADDLTRPAVADALGAPLGVDPQVEAWLRERYRKSGEDDIPPANRRVLEVPRGGEPLRNPVGTAPGLVLTPRYLPLDVEAGADPFPDPRRLVAMVPGVPREMRALFPEVEARIRATFGDELAPVFTRTLHTTGIAESRLAPRIEEVLDGLETPVSVAYLPDLIGVDLRLTVATSGGRETVGVDEELDRVEAALNPVLAPYRIGNDSGDLAAEVLERLGERGWMLGLGESCTGGLVAKRLTDIPGSSRVLAGGVVAYGDEAKTALLGVPAQVIRSRGAVSEAVARALATGARDRFDCRCGVGITGIAGPGGGTEDKPVGTVWMAAAVGERVLAQCHVFPGDRESVRIRAAQAALALLLEAVEAGEDP